ncbi:HDOD domain-containing protein [Pseudoalteromonas sp. JBTF-M23]|uniref:HDOD domain-containing protein n=1 Tax=Pseudoalteromonas caenipelagi TaxID=2726988 RepID=A0A849VD33_9GAMM|nr:HDOD domain-containing protein [Pseudoalteromonas caenipelagi]NOU49657.1 HDOD domain-containing protein [Pseudoalteromonas caenipelagi]
MNFYAARQPIFDSDNKPIGYEILFRNGPNNEFPGINADKATSQLLEGSQFYFELEELSNHKPAFINFTLNTLVLGYPFMLSPQHMVIEVVESIEPGKRLLECTKALHKKGYRVALDHYRHQAAWRHFYPYIKYLKIDVTSTPWPEIQLIKKEIQQHKHIQLIAEKVETHQQLEQLKELGFQFFQGFYFAKPEMLESKMFSASELSITKLLSETANEYVDVKRLTPIFERDVNLSYKLLRYTNSAIFKRRTKISNIKQALVTLGNQELKKFLSLMFAAQISPDKPAELIKMSLTRARFCEQLALNANSKKYVGPAFLTGMMSLIDAIRDDSMENIMGHLPLVDSIKQALVVREGPLAHLLLIVQSYEQADWLTAQKQCRALNINPEILPLIYNDALSWCDEQMQVLACEI